MKMKFSDYEWEETERENGFENIDEKFPLWYTEGVK